MIYPRAKIMMTKKSITQLLCQKCPNVYSLDNPKFDCCSGILFKTTHGPWSDNSLNHHASCMKKRNKYSLKIIEEITNGSSSLK